MKAAVEAMRNKEMGSYKAPRFFIICLPPHSSHKMQPLDKAFIGPSKTFYCEDIGKWFRSNPGRVVTVYQIGEMFGNAYKEAAPGTTAANGFRAKAFFFVKITS